jgi:hypothetical protein
MGGVEYTICSLLSALLIEGLWRRKVSMFTAAGMSACFAVIASLLSTRERVNKLAAAGLLFLFDTFLIDGNSGQLKVILLGNDIEILFYLGRF